MQGRRGATLLLLLLLTSLLFQYGRRALHVQESPRPFYAELKAGVLVELADGFERSGIYQFSDGMTPTDVIKLTGSFSSTESAVTQSALQSGEVLSVVFDRGKLVEVRRVWMSAGKRMALGIPLHPDRMSLSDWESLPGIGPRLADMIEKDRQKNGDFVDYHNLTRVKGIGKGRLHAWEKYFLCL